MTLKRITAVNDWESYKWLADGELIDASKLIHLQISRKKFVPKWKDVSRSYSDHGHTYHATSIDLFVVEPTFCSDIAVTDLLRRKFKIYGQFQD